MCEVWRLCLWVVSVVISFLQKHLAVLWTTGFGVVQRVLHSKKLQATPGYSTTQDILVKLQNGGGVEWC